MQIKPPYRYGGIDYPTLGAIKTHIQGVIGYKNRVVEREFFDDVLADVVLDRHYRWIHKKIRPTSFKFMVSTQGDGRTWSDSLAGFFPGYGWQRFSYRTALRAKPVTLESEFSRLCRERWARLWRARLWRAQFIRYDTMCAIGTCNLRAVDIDHIHPQHREIVRQCWALVDSTTATQWWERILDPGDEHFTLPDGHPVTMLYDNLTRCGTYQVVCRLHHRKITAARKAARKAVREAVREDMEDYKREMLQQQAKRRRETQEFEERQDKKYAAVEDSTLLRDPNFAWIHRALVKDGWTVSAMIKKSEK